MSTASTEGRAPLPVFRSLLSDPDCPRAWVLRGGEHEFIPVRRFYEFAAERGGLGAASDVDLDELVRQLGGRNVMVTDPWRRIENVLRGIAGLPAKQAEELWEVPRSAIQRS